MYYNPGYVWSTDFSAGKTFEPDVIIKTIAGTDLEPVIMHKALRQQFNIGIAVNGLGRMMSPIIGVKGNRNVEKGKPIIEVLTDPMLLDNFFRSDIAPPLLVTYAHGDKACLADLFYTRIMDPVLMSQQDELRRKNTRHVIMCDGVGDNLALVNTLEKLDEWDSKRRVLLKLAANATSTTQVCDLLKFFHLIKMPHDALKKLNQARFTQHCATIRRQCQQMRTTMDAQKANEFVQALALLFYVRFPRLERVEIMERFDDIGWNDDTGGRCMALCKDPLDNEEWDQYKAAFPAIIKETIKSGLCTHAFLISLGLPGGELNPDGKSLKSQRCMLLTGTAARAIVMAKMEAEEKAKEKKVEKDRLQQEKKEKAKRRREAKKDGDAKGKRKSLNPKCIKALRAEAAEAKQIDNDSKCITCPMTWSKLFENRNKYTNLVMYECDHCKTYTCSLCFPSQTIFELGHESPCALLLAAGSKLALGAQQLEDEHEDEQGEDMMEEELQDANDEE